MSYLKGFKLSPFIDCNPNIYPDHIFRNMAGEVIWFDRITILYGHNGSGKSTILNIIANKLELAGHELMKSSGIHDYAGNFLDYCSPIFHDQSIYRTSNPLPSKSRYIKSEDLLYEIKKIQQKQILRESLFVDKASAVDSKEELHNYLQSVEMHKQLERISFSQEKYSNGETAMMWFEQELQPEALYLLDEPETSLSPKNQLLLAERINQLARYEQCQFIIATHSPFLLGHLVSKIYDLSNNRLASAEWFQLEHIRDYFQFFQTYQHLFK